MVPQLCALFCTHNYGTPVFISSPGNLGRRRSSSRPGSSSIDSSIHSGLLFRPNPRRSSHPLVHFFSRSSRYVSFQQQIFPLTIVGSLLCIAVRPIHSLHMAGLLWMCGSTGLFLLPYIYHHILARFIKGIANGLVSVAVPLYVYEMFPQSYTRTIAAFNMCSSLGSFLAVLYTYLCCEFIRKDTYPYIWVAESFWGLLLLVCSFFLPKLFPLRASFRVPTAPRALERGTAITKPTSGYGETQGPRFSLSLFRASQIQASAMFTCVPALMPLFVEITWGLGLRKNESGSVQLLQYVTVAMCSVILVGLSLYSRKDPLVFGLVILGAAFSAICALFKIYGTGYYGNLVNLQLVGHPASCVLALFMLAFSVFYTFVLPTSAIYSVELVEGSPSGVSLSTCIIWGSRAVSTYGVLCLLDLVHGWTFAIIASLSFVGALIILLFPERSDMSVADYLSGLSSPKEKDPESFSSGTTFEGEISPPERPAQLPAMAFQNFVPLHSSSRNVLDLSLLRGSLDSEEYPTVSRRDKSGRLFTAQSHFSPSSSSYGENYKEPDQGNNAENQNFLFTALWLETSELHPPRQE